MKSYLTELAKDAPAIGLWVSFITWAATALGK